MNRLCAGPGGRRAPISKRRKIPKKPQPRRAIKSGLAPGTPVFIGERKQTDVQVSLVTYTPQQVTENHNVALKECTVPGVGEGIRWINVVGLHDVTFIEGITRQFALHPLTLEDIVNSGQRPKAEDFDHYLFLVLKMLSFDNEKNEINIENVSLILGQNYVISFQEQEGDVFDPLRERLRSGKGRLRSAGADFLAYSLLDAVLDGYFVAIEKLGDHIDDIDDKILAHPDLALMQNIHHLKRELLFLRKSVWPLREEISLLEKLDTRLITPATRTFLRDVYDHSIQVIDMVETYRDIIGGMHDTYLSSISNRMNEIIKVLTIISTLFIPLTFIAGVYGMNFANMPELQWRFGYFLVLGVMASVVAGLLLFFRRRNWF